MTAYVLRGDARQPTLEVAISSELDRLARLHVSPEAFEALCWVLWQSSPRSAEKRGES